MLLQWIVERANAASVELILETVGPRNQGFYESAGFECLAKTGAITARLQDGNTDTFEEHGGVSFMVRHPTPNSSRL
jgi:hypothetical protein